jgi:hypothetical protein
VTVHVSGSDLAHIFAAAISSPGQAMSPGERLHEANELISGFLSIVEVLTGSRPQVGDPFVINQDPDTMPRWGGHG